MNITNIEKNCMACGACINTCSVKALEMTINEDGFYQPALIPDKCINCSKCVNICPELKEYCGHINSNYYYGWINDEKVRLDSTSGGAFFSFASKVLDNGGVVYGAAYDDNYVVKMESSDTVSLKSIMQTKYCQSFYNDIYLDIEKNINNGREVLVCSTPCQIAGLRSYFGQNDNLILVDFICGGVSPQKFLSEYLDMLRNKFKANITYVNMRCKDKGWSTPHIKVLFDNGKKYIKRYQFDYYLHYFYKLSIKNESCLNCKYFEHSCADITIGDFWGYRKEHINNDEKGISLICLHTKIGKKLFETMDKAVFLSNELKQPQVEYAFAPKKYSNEQIAERKDFLDTARKNSFIEAAKKNDFRFGKVGIVIAYIKRKVMKNVKRK